MSRRWLVSVVFVCVSLSLFNAAFAERVAAISPAAAIQRLIEGNQRYIQDRLEHPNRTQESRDSVLETQRPFATILGCADSRVAPEILFDQGIGDLFVVRVAGNVAGPVVIDSVDYSALQLGSSLILVLGHENCGAIKAVVNRQTKGMESVASLIEPALVSTKGMAGNPIENAVEANIRYVVKRLKDSPVIADLIQQGKIDVVGGYYHLTTGEVEILR